MAAETGGAPHFDWGLGRYERTAAQLAPASAIVVERADPRVAEKVLDLGCGTGNAALLAAARGATVTAVDPAVRLLDVARARAAHDHLDVSFALGEAAAIPAEGGSFDVVLSVFGVIFAPNPVAAAAEIARVSSADARLVFSAWLPGGAVSQVVRMARQTAMAALGAPPSPPPFAWHDHLALRELLGPHRFDVAVETHSHRFTAASIDDYLEGQLVDHPLSVASRAMLDARGVGDVHDEIVERARQIMTEANESLDAFAVTGGYVVATAQRS